MKGSIIALSNALTDIVVNVTEEDLIKFGLIKGCSHYNPRIHLDQFLKDGNYIPGGSPANVVAGASYLGAKCGLIGTVGNDYIGKLYREDLKSNGITDYLTTVEGDSGVCYVLVTPDGERTSFTKLGVCGDFHIPFEEIKKYKVFHTSGYELITNPKKTIEALEYAYENEVKISFDVSDSRLVIENRDMVFDAISFVDILFANEYEAVALTGLEPEKAIEKMGYMCELAVVKLGKDGSLVKGKSLYEISAYPTNVVDTNGAGDGYAAGFLYEYTRGRSIELCGDSGSRFASKICGKQGARIR